MNNEAKISNILVSDTEEQILAYADNIYHKDVNTIRGTNYLSEDQESINKTLIGSTYDILKGLSWPYDLELDKQINLPYSIQSAVERIPKSLFNQPWYREYLGEGKFPQRDPGSSDWDKHSLDGVVKYFMEEVYPVIKEHSTYNIGSMYLKLDAIEGYFTQGTGVPTEIIDTFNEIKDFLSGYETTTTLIQEFQNISKECTKYDVVLTSDTAIVNIPRNEQAVTARISTKVVKSTFANPTGSNCTIKDGTTLVMGNTPLPNPTGAFRDITLPKVKNYTKIEYSPVYDSITGTNDSASLKIYYAPPIIGRYMKWDWDYFGGKIDFYNCTPDYNEGDPGYVNNDPACSAIVGIKNTGKETVIIDMVPEWEQTLDELGTKYLNILLFIPKGYFLDPIKPFFQPDGLDQEIPFEHDGTSGFHYTSWAEDGHEDVHGYNIFHSTVKVDASVPKRIGINIYAKKFSEY